MISVFQSLTWSTAFAWTMPIACIPLSTYLEKEGGERRTRCKYARQARDDVCHDQETHIVTPVTAPDIGETMNAAVAPTSSDVRSFVSGAFALQ